MTYTVMAHIRRKEEITPVEFRQHYDKAHVPLLKSLVSPASPLSHTRNYVTRNPKPAVAADLVPGSEDANKDFAPVICTGEQSTDIDHDLVTVMVWDGKAAFDRFCAAFVSPDALNKIVSDNENCLDSTLQFAYAVEEPAVTRQDE